MALTAERKAQLDAIIAQQKATQGEPNPAMGQPSGKSGLTPERKAYLDQIIAQQKAQQAPQRKPSNLLTGLAKPFIKTAAAIPAVVGGLSHLAQGDAAGASEALTRERDFGPLGSSRPIGINQETGQKQKFGELAKDVVGTGAEIASYAAPAGILGKGTGLSAKVGAATKAGVLGGSLGGLGQGLQEEQPISKTIAQTATGGVLGGLTGGALPILGAATRKIASGAGKLGAEVLGRTTGAGEAAIKEAFNNPNVVKFARQAGKEGPEGLMTQALEDAQKGLKKMKTIRGSEYTADLSKIKMDKSQLDSIIQDARQGARNWLSESGVKIKEGKLLNTLDFADSTIERGQGTVQKAFNDVMRWTDVTPAGLDKLQKKLSQHLDEIPVTERGGAFQFVLDMKNSVSNRLKEDVRGYRQMTAKYHEASDLIDEIQRALSLKDTAAKDTAVRKLMSAMRQNNELRNEMLGVLGRAGGSDITGKIAGATLAPVTPRGLIGALTPTTVGLGGASALLSGVINPSQLPIILLTLSAASPRLMAEAVTLIGKIKGRTIPPQIQRALKNLIIQASREAATSNSP